MKIERSRRRFVATGLGLAATLAFNPRALAQAGYPDKPIRLIVPFPPGGQTDAVARMVAEGLSQRLGQQVFVDTRAGAGGNIGSGLAAAAKADGYTLLLVPDSNMTISPLIYKNLPYDPITGFVPVGKIGDTALVMVSNPSGDLKTIADVIRQGRAQGAGLTYASAGIGTNTHIVGELFRERANINLVHIPYQGTGPATADLLAGRVQLLLTSVGGATPMIKSGKFHPIAVFTRARARSLPEVPTFVESGMPGLVYNSWIAMFAPAQVPQSVLTRLNGELNAVLAQPELRGKLEHMGITPVAVTPEAFADEIKRDLDRYRPIIQSAGIRAD